MVEIESLEAFDAWVAEHASLSGVALQGVDLCDRTEILMSLEVSGAAFLGCLLAPVVQERLHHGHALVFPPFHELPFNAFRSTLYTAEELFAGYEPGQPATFDLALDTRVYKWHMDHKNRHDVVDALAERIHDHAVDDLSLIHI